MSDLIDIGANLTHDSYDSDRAAVIADARAAGVAQMIVTGTTVTASARAVELSLGRPGVLFATTGIHPHHATECADGWVAALEQLSNDASVVAIGECGLDYFRDFSPRADQLRAFEAQLELATSAGLPVFLHQRDAHDDMLRLLQKFRHNLPGGVAHCFTGDSEQMSAYLDLDLYIGVTGWICDERRGDSLRQAVTSLPLDRMLVETDAPYLLPRDLDPPTKTRRNEPKFLPHIVKRIALLVNRPFEEVAAAATSNARRLFALDSHTD